MDKLPIPVDSSTEQTHFLEWGDLWDWMYAHERKQQMVRFSNLVALSVHDSDVPAEVANSDLGKALEKALAKHKEEKEAAAATEILEALKLLETTKNRSRQNIKRLRAQMKEQTDSLEKLDRCLAYGQETSNFLPLLVTLGAVSSYYGEEFGMDRKEFQAASEVPADWKPKA